MAAEKHPPYDRPPLTKKLWFGQQKVEDIFLHDRKFYDDNGVSLALGAKAASLDAGRKTVTDGRGQDYRFDKLLLATGGVPRPLPIPGGDLEGVCYFRDLDDYLRLRGDAADGKSALVIGGGFIGSEIAAALTANKVRVTMIFPSAHLCSRVFPVELGRAVQARYVEKGIQILSADRPVMIARRGGRFATRTRNGKHIASDLVVVGVGIAPAVELARAAGLDTADGIVVNEYLQTSHPDIYAAGDNALFPYPALGVRTRVEHWDNALSQGRWAGVNMAGARVPFTYMPYFFSDLFEFGYEAVGQASSDLETFADWQKENDTGVIYYLKDGKVRGAMMCNVRGKVGAARRLILSGSRGERIQPRSLAGAIR